MHGSARPIAGAARSFWPHDIPSVHPGVRDSGIATGVPSNLNADQLCLLAAGLFFFSALLTGVWKYLCIARSESATAPVYVDISHRTSLMYSFSALLLREFVPYSPLSPAGTLWAVGLPLLFFGSAIAIYCLHGLLRDTDNQFQKPHRLGALTLPGIAIHGFMWLLIAGEIGGFSILLYGFLTSLT